MFNSSIKFFAGLLLLTVVTFGCQKENIVGEVNHDAVQGVANPHLFRSISPCGQSLITAFEDGSNVLGDVEVNNDANFIYVTIHMTADNSMNNLSVFVGEASSLPLDVDGDLDITQFTFHQNLSSANTYTVLVPITGLPSCPQVLIQSSITTQDPNTFVSTTRDVWASGTAIYNGQANNFCSTICPNDDTTI